ncbi:uncharacterized protein THITE_73567 [Thermothielavioides terrestris NRRL 8126]|uniref:Uncharacterized protein n=1 Tax=Thermothielavioides terrestris (strain ATCC 38088 / NRRL 8126) TaxID=578455 RepID=G2RDS0_THETT|nr:uncharacterized protein THITE_73567 [Thermothielavioides terrestris NRRL 8126]AEO70001.1 hypothetical protein THITE_73567 [Thermothielavioides terrestris NRRL 8126]
MASGIAAGSSRSRTSLFSTEFLVPKWAKLFFLVVGLQALICVAFESYIIGLCVANLAIFIYAVLQIDQIDNSISRLLQAGALKPDADDSDVWAFARPFLIAVPAIVGVVTVLMGGIAYKLYREFAWDILKLIGADYRMKKRFLHYQIYIALLKFDFFFFLGFTVQFLVIVNGISDAEMGLHIAAIPVTIAILLCAAFFTQRENRIGMCLVILLYFGGLAYFFFKLVRIYQPGHSQDYVAVRRSLTAFAVLTIILIILTIINAFICMSNFGAGLKAHLVRPRGPDPEKEDANSYQMNDHKPQLPSRMTID